MTSQNITASIPESLQLIEAWLHSRYYVTAMKRVTPGTLQPGPGVVSTITGWRLTWSRRTMNSWVECGSITVADGEAPFQNEIPFTLE